MYGRSRDHVRPPPSLAKHPFCRLRKSNFVHNSAQSPRASLGMLGPYTKSTSLHHMAPRPGAAAGAICVRNPIFGFPEWASHRYRARETAFRKAAGFSEIERALYWKLESGRVRWSLHGRSTVAPWSLHGRSTVAPRSLDGRSTANLRLLEGVPKTNFRL